MNTGEWHWAQLKRDFEIEDRDLLNAIGENEPFVLPAGTLVYVYKTDNNPPSSMKITLSPTMLDINTWAFQSEFDYSYAYLLEPLE